VRRSLPGHEALLVYSAKPPDGPAAAGLGMRSTLPDYLPASAWLIRFSALVRPGSEILDLACGRGRHARLFLSMGHRVVLVDRDVTAVIDLDSDPSAEILRTDLEDGTGWPLPNRVFDAVVVTNYLHRPLFPDIFAAVAPGGLLIYETFAVGNEKFGRPARPEYLLRQGELTELVEPSFQVIAFEDVELGAPRAAVVQRIAARKLQQG
jgi:SAM-dependent methyltransferase